MKKSPKQIRREVNDFLRAHAQGARAKRHHAAKPEPAKHKGTYKPPVDLTLSKKPLRQRELSQQYARGYKASSGLVLGWDIEPTDAIVAIDALYENKVDLGMKLVGLQEAFRGLRNAAQRPNAMDATEIKQWTDGFVNATIDRLERVAGLREG